MAPTLPSLKMWQLRLAGVGLLLLALLSGLAAPTSAYAYDPDDDDEREEVTTGPNACTAIANLPLYPNASCLQHETELDDGVTERKDYYATQDAADTVRKAYEAAFRANGWTIVASEYDAGDLEWEYTVTRGQRPVQVTIEARQPTAGAGTVIKIEE